MGLDWGIVAQGVGGAVEGAGEAAMQVNTDQIKRDAMMLQAQMLAKLDVEKAGAIKQQDVNIANANAATDAKNKAAAAGAEADAKAASAATAPESNEHKMARAQQDKQFQDAQAQRAAEAAQRSADTQAGQRNTAAIAAAAQAGAGARNDARLDVRTAAEDAKQGNVADRADAKWQASKADPSVEVNNSSPQFRGISRQLVPGDPGSQGEPGYFGTSIGAKPATPASGSHYEYYDSSGKSIPDPTGGAQNSVAASPGAAALHALAGGTPSPAAPAAQPKAAPSTQFQNGKVYTDAKGNKALYNNGQWIPQ